MPQAGFRATTEPLILANFCCKSRQFVAHVRALHQVSIAASGGSMGTAACCPRVHAGPRSAARETVRLCPYAHASPLVRSLLGGTSRTHVVRHGVRARTANGRAKGRGPLLGCANQLVRVARPGRGNAREPTNASVLAQTSGTGATTTGGAIFTLGVHETRSLRSLSPGANGDCSRLFRPAFLAVLCRRRT